MKKIKNVSVIILFAISFFIHFLYDKIPNDFTLIFAPINESIFEHMKIIATAVLIYSFFEIIYFKYKNINVNNYILSVFTSIFIGIVFYLIIFIPIYLLIGHNMIFTLILLFITYILITRISIYIYNIKDIKYLNYLSICLIIIVYIVFSYLSYYPFKNFLFYDEENEKYGINEYKI